MTKQQIATAEKTALQKQKGPWRGWKPARVEKSLWVVINGGPARTLYGLEHGPLDHHVVDHPRMYTQIVDGRREYLMASDCYPLVTEDLRNLLAACDKHGLEVELSARAHHNPEGCFCIWFTRKGVNNAAWKQWHAQSAEAQVDTVL